MTPLDVLTQVNVDINQIPYRAEVVDDWTPVVPGVNAGADCDSYATAKMQELYNKGWPVDIMRLATCWDENGNSHAVLLVDLNKQTWVLDNRYPLPQEYQMLEYQWRRIQIAGTQRWQIPKQPT